MIRHRIYRDRAALLGALALSRCIGALHIVANKLLKSAGFYPSCDMFVTVDGTLDHLDCCPACGGDKYGGAEACTYCSDGKKFFEVKARMILSGEFDE